MDQDDDRLPLPSEDSGDLVDEPRAGMTDDPIVAVEEGVPYDPPTERVVEAGLGGDTDIASATTTSRSPTSFAAASRRATTSCGRTWSRR